MKWIQNNRGKTIEDIVLANTGYSSLDDLNCVDKQYRIDNIDKVVDIINNYQGIVYIRGDYDCDGVCASAIFEITLKALGFQTDVHLPHRFTEGYGLSEKMIDDIPDGPHLLITVDNGITAVDSIKKAKEKGLIVIITDHHLCRDDGMIPNADIIIDPNAIPNTATFNGYCGAGLAYKICEKLLENHPQRDELISKLISLAAIATVADVMELIEENRLIVKKGLESMVGFGRTKGLYALLNLCGMDQHITAKDIGFKIAPCINAAGRILDDGATLSFKLLTEDEFDIQAEIYARELNQLNEQRKLMKEEGLKKLYKYIEDNNMQNDIPMCIYYPALHEGIIGIYAGNIAEEFKRPCLIFTDSDKEGIYKGSARSADGYNLKALLDKCADVFVKYGGHAGAAGMSVEASRFDEMKTCLAKNCDFKVKSIDEIYYDLEITEEDIEKIIPQLEAYAPFGEGNPEIIFKTNFTISPVMSDYFRVMGNKSQHIKLLGKCSNAVCFDATRRYLIENAETFPDNVALYKILRDENIENDEAVLAYEEYHKEHRNVTPVLNLEMLGMLSENFFAGKTSPQIETIDFKLCKKEKPKTSLAQMLANRANKRY